jgi:hypothetical protein
MMVLYFIQFMDKTTLGSSAILGIRYVFCCLSARVLNVYQGSNPSNNKPVRIISTAT